MKRALPRSKKVVLIVETLAVMLFALGLYWNVSLYLEVKGLNEACTRLERAGVKLERLDKRIRNYEKIRKRLASGEAKEVNFRWEDIEIEFEPVDFSSLLTRLSLLNSEIESKYHKHGLFVLTSFETVKPDNQAEKQDPASKAEKEPLRPGFKIEGRLLCL